jgi:putative DNA primase/helicase
MMVPKAARGWCDKCRIYQREGEKEDWTVDELYRKATTTVVDRGGATPALNQMGASQRGEVLLAHYDGELAIHADSDTVHHYNGVIWNPLPDKELQREMAQIYIDAETSYSQNAIKSAETMKLSLPVMGVTARNLSASAMGYLIPERAIQGAR